MNWFCVILCSYQPEPFMVKADSLDAAIIHTINWALNEYPGIVERKGVVLKEPGFPLISKVEDREWN